MATHNQVNHPVIDDDAALFTINPVTRAIEYNSPDELIIMKDDTNSERLSFEIPKIIEGHNMSLCDVVQVHYINSGTSGSGENPDIYLVNDLAEDPNNEEMLRFTWLVSRNATKLPGTVKFAVRFYCTDASTENTEEDKPVTGRILYEWSTAISDVIKIGDTIRNDDALEEEVLPDIIAGLQTQLTYAYEWITDPDDPSATERTFLKVTNYDGVVETSDNLKSSVKGDKGNKGDKGDIGLTPLIKIGDVTTVDADNPTPSVTVAGYDENNNPTLDFNLPEPPRDYVTDINGNQLWFFSGTQEEYDALSDEKKARLFALITDDESEENMLQEIEELSNDVAGLSDKVDSLNTDVNRVTADHALYEYRGCYEIEDNVSFPGLYKYTTVLTPTPELADGDSLHELPYLENINSASANLISINGTAIPRDGSEALINTMTWGSNGEKLKHIARYDSETDQIKLITRVFYFYNTTYESIEVRIVSYDGIMQDDKLTEISGSLNVFELNAVSFLQRLSIISKTLNKGDYILDGNNVLYEVIDMPSESSDIVKLLTIRPDIDALKNSIRNLHYKTITLNTINHSLVDGDDEETNVFSYAFTGTTLETYFGSFTEEGIELTNCHIVLPTGITAEPIIMYDGKVHEGKFWYRFKSSTSETITSLKLGFRPIL